MLCKKCGKENDEKDLYCVYCGALLESGPKPVQKEESAEEKPVKESVEDEPAEEPVKEDPIEETAVEEKLQEEPVKAAASISEEKKKKSEKKVNLSVKISLVIVLLMGIAFLATGFALGLFDDIEEFIETKKEEIAEEQAKPSKDSMAATLADAVFEGKTVFDCTGQKDALLTDVQGERTIERYALVDMNGDGGKELVLEMGKDMDRFMVVLHQGKKGVLGRGFPFRDMQLISEYGTYKGNKETETDVYSALQITDKSMEPAEIATGEFSAQKIAEKTGAELKEVSLEEFTQFVNRRFGARTIGFKEYSEAELKKDLENPDGFDLIDVQDMGIAYWGVIIPELGQYNDLIGSSYSKFERRENYVYSDDAKWEHDAKELLCCVTGDDLKYVGTDDSIYDAEYIGVKDDAIIMSGAATDVKDTLAQDFILDDADFQNAPTQFCIRKAEGKDKGITALVWSCGDTYLCIFVNGDAGKTAFYDRPVVSVCYVLKECSSVLGYPQIFE